MGRKKPLKVIQDVGFRLVDCNNLSQHGKKIITSDPDVLDWVEHCHIEFMDNAPPIL